MARGPYQGTFIPNIRPTVVTAPDAIVYINGEQEIIGCPQCSRSFDFNKYITSIQTDLSVESVPGSASIQLSVPRHSIDDFYFDGTPVITPMMEIEIFAKGYYLVEGIPQYYPIFWGLITEVSDNYSAGEHTVSISCSDILKWWELCQMNINPAYLAPSGSRSWNMGLNVYNRTNPYDMIFTLAFQSFGDVVVGTGSLNQLVKERGSQRGTFDAALSDIMGYWEQRFQRMRSNLVLYGTQGVAVRGDTLYQAYSRNNPPGTVPKRAYASTAVQYANGGKDGGQMVYDPTSNRVSAIREQLQSMNVDLWQSEFQTKLELANAAKEAIGFEFYMDATGDIVFKPPFYNLDVLGNKPLSWIQDIDIIDWDFGDSESEVVTQIIMQGQAFGLTDVGAPGDISPFASVTDYHLLRKYGWRSRPLNSEFLSSTHAMFYHGLDLLDRINSRRHRGSISVPMRPELRLGFPVYVAPKDQIWYLSGISHSMSFGSRATTTLNLTAKRSKFVAPRGMGDLKLKDFAGEPEANKEGTPRTFHYSSRQLAKSGVFTLEKRNAATLPPDDEAFTNMEPGADNPYEPLVLRHPKTGRVVGYPNVVMAYTRAFAPADISNQAGQKSPSRKRPYVAKRRQAQQRETLKEFNERSFSAAKANEEDTLIDKYANNRYQYGLNSAGVYIYAHDSSARGGAISELLTLRKDNIKVTPEDDATLKALKAQTTLIRPISDERGFEVIGHYRYGRRVSLKDGRLITNAGTQTRATVDVQLALSGRMQEMLTGASQGLTTVSTGYADPARTIATLTTEDRQTAAILNPDTKSPEFQEVGDNFIDSAPLGSQQQQGSSEVEAAQLSRALTLQEMSVRDSSTTQENCICLTGRQDLVFINTGYQVKTLSSPGAEEETTVLASLEAAGGPVNSGATQQAAGAVDLIQAELNEAQWKLDVLDKKSKRPEGTYADGQEYADQLKVVDRLKEQLEAAQYKLDELQVKYRTVNSIFAQPPSELVSKIDEFLVNLYTALDKPHQEFEKAIRGDYLPKTPRDTATKSEQIVRPSELAPPFSAPRRASLGDPEAAVGAIKTNAENIQKSWKDFSKKLRENARRTSLTKQIERDQASIQRLTQTRDQLIQQQESSAVVVGINVPEAIASIDEQIADLRQRVDDNQAKIRTG